MTKSIAFFGTGSDVGKSIITSAFCRILANRGFSVAPYKAQNMSNNSWVTIEQKEMGRAQVVQAHAARVVPHVDMNPILLKPSADQHAQVIIQGLVLGQKQARDYFDMHEFCRKKAFESYDRLAERYEYICIEGAGSCAEMNLKKTDFVNFAAACHAKAPVILVADIDRGGVFAQIIGTLAILSENERRMVKGIIINRFRGDISLFEGGCAYIEKMTGVDVLGVVPHIQSLQIDAEDAVPLGAILDPVSPPARDTIAIAVAYVPHISNFTDFNPLLYYPGITLHFISRPRNLSNYDCLILPGTKNVAADLAFLRKEGWEECIRTFTGKIAGICGGYQMLGRKVHDPDGVEGNEENVPGLGLLDVETVMTTKKKLAQVKGWCELFDTPVSGYEIHMGITRNTSLASLVTLSTVNEPDTKYQDGAVSNRGNIFGTYVHGIFDTPQFLEHFIKWVDPDKADVFLKRNCKTYSYDSELDRLAQHIAGHVDIEKVLKLLENGLS